MKRYFIAILLGSVPLAWLTTQSLLLFLGVSSESPGDRPKSQSPQAAQKQVDEASSYLEKNQATLDGLAGLHFHRDSNDLTMDWKDATQDVKDACLPLKGIQEERKRLEDLLNLKRDTAVDEEKELETWITTHDGSARNRTLVSLLKSRLKQLGLTALVSSANIQARKALDREDYNECVRLLRRFYAEREQITVPEVRAQTEKLYNQANLRVTFATLESVLQGGNTDAIRLADQRFREARLASGGILPLKMEQKWTTMRPTLQDILEAATLKDLKRIPSAKLSTFLEQAAAAIRQYPGLISKVREEAQLRLEGLLRPMNAGRFQDLRFVTSKAGVKTVGYFWYDRDHNRYWFWEITGDLEKDQRALADFKKVSNNHGFKYQGRDFIEPAPQAITEFDRIRRWNTLLETSRTSMTKVDTWESLNRNCQQWEKDVQEARRSRGQLGLPVVSFKKYCDLCETVLDSRQHLETIFGR